MANWKLTNTHGQARGFLRHEFYDLHGYVICDYLSRDEAEAILDSFDKWAENANWGDDYVYDGNHYTLEHP